MKETYAVTRRSRALALGAIDAAGGAVRGLRRTQRTRQTPEEVRRVLLVRPEHWGDLITLLPAIERCRALFPRGRIAVMLRSAYAEFMASTGAVDEVLPVDDGWPASRSVAGAWRRMRSTGSPFQLAFDFLGDLRNLAVARVAASCVAGYGIRGGRFLLDVQAEYPWRIPAAQRQLWLIESAHAEMAGEPPALTAEPVRPRLAAMAEWAEASERVLEALPRAQGRPYVIVHPGSGQPSKRWPIERWPAVARRIVDAGRDVILTGGEMERYDCDRIAMLCGASAERVHNLAGMTTLAALAGLVSQAESVLAPDTGIIHLAQALGRPSVGLFGPNDPQVWGYETERNRSLANPLACSFCERGQCPRRDYPGACMAALSSGRVTRTWEQLTFCPSPVGP